MKAAASRYLTNTFTLSIQIDLKLKRCNSCTLTCSWFSVSTSSVRLSQFPMLSGRKVRRFWSAFNMESFRSFPVDTETMNQSGDFFVNDGNHEDEGDEIATMAGVWMGIVTDAFWQSIDDVLRNQQVSEQRQIAQLLWEPLQFVFRHVQTQQALHVANFL